MFKCKNKKHILPCLLVFFVLACFGNKAGDSNKNYFSEADTSEAVDELPVETGPPPPVMVPYEGEVLNIFFHPLVARPETAFRSKDRAHFLEWYITAGEYKKLLYEFYIQDYALLDINDFYEVTHTDGIRKIAVKKLLVPEGKKPLILSIDDLSYYDFVRETASVHKLVIDENGRIAAWTETADSGAASSGAASSGELSYDLDIITITEEFIREYPDFSINGAKGIIALTGYEGVLGYHTHELDKPGYKEKAEQAIAVVNRLKELGWRFASHSWGHPNLPNVPMTRFMSDTNRWDKEVRPIIGDTDLFIYPFGAGLENNEERHKILRDRNFIVFFDVGRGWGHKIGPESEYLYFTRINIDGFHFRVYKDRADRLFDIDKVIDREARSIR
ncbi:MAG: polysaccharide deacetylase family protein [Treponema sp.]|jgi:hypothetical protein|nr:polysaccharide deacetylase family protein [Treponema sp.]